MTRRGPCANQCGRMIEHPGPGRICGRCAHYLRINTNPPRSTTMTDDQLKQAETLSIDNDGATVAHDPATDTLTVENDGDGSYRVSDLLASLGVAKITADQALADFPPGSAEQAPTSDQYKRARSKPKGLRGLALATYVLTGDHIDEQVKKARAKRPVAPKPPRAKTAAKPAATKKQVGSLTRPRYPEEITDAVRRAKIARGTKAGAPGAKQHVLTREVVAGMAATDDVPVNTDAILKAAGAKTQKMLRMMADGTGTKDDLKNIQPLARVIPDPFCSGRNLASILVAWVDQIKEAKA